MRSRENPAVTAVTGVQVTDFRHFGSSIEI